MGTEGGEVVEGRSRSKTPVGRCMPEGSRTGETSTQTDPTLPIPKGPIKGGKAMQVSMVLTGLAVSWMDGKEKTIQN